MNSYQQNATLLKKEKLGPDTYRLTLAAYDIAKAAKPGQFVMLKISPLYDPLLRRPFSIHQITAKGNLQILVKVIGKGTKIITGLEEGDQVDLVGPLGNSFDYKDKENFALVGGGIGMAPLLFLTKSIQMRLEPVNIKIFLGAQNKDEITQLIGDFEEAGAEVIHATDDGSSGHHGFVTDLIQPILLNSEIKSWQVLACGPHPMLKKTAILSKANNWPCQLSTETIMACGIGACLGCTIKGEPRENKGREGYLHVCKDGPVFNAEQIKW